MDPLAGRAVASEAPSKLEAWLERRRKQARKDDLDDFNEMQVRFLISYFIYTSVPGLYQISDI